MARRWFQFHLLTLVLLTATSGLLIGANLVPRNAYKTESESVASFGWPLLYVVPFPELRGRYSNPYVNDGRLQDFHIRSFDLWDTGNAVIDIAVGLFLLAIVTLGSEFFLRRRRLSAIAKGDSDG